MNRRRGPGVSESGMVWRGGAIAILGVAALGLTGAGWPTQMGPTQTGQAQTGQTRGMQAQAAQTQMARPAPMPEHLPGMGMPAMQRMMAHPGAVVVSMGSQEQMWTAESLRALPPVSVTVYDKHSKAQEMFTGVPVSVLLQRVGFPLQQHGKDFRLFMVATGADGYEVVFSGGELTPDVHDGTVLVAYAMQGKALGKDGPLQVVVTGDKRPARWVRNLASLRVGQTP